MIKETLRVRPVVPEVFRAPTETTELGGYQFAPGTQLAASILLVQRDPELYPPDPEAFRPERFLDGAPEPYTWVPFGGGVRRCLGAAFATLEMKVVISTILSRARLRAPRAKAEKARFRGVTLLPSRGGEAVVERLVACPCRTRRPRRSLSKNHRRRPLPSAARLSREARAVHDRRSPRPPAAACRASDDRESREHLGPSSGRTNGTTTASSLCNDSARAAACRRRESPRFEAPVGVGDHQRNSQPARWSLTSPAACIRE